ncbi:hypothetical protein RchiOBHm_Chr6g0259601 [Rosa chinensis]|uniref:Uncharacterized protein n=1 Tax=Rosa chinensis TaxID=74649 RepID=A0A2P6PMW5_ROSCH|nr:hypothetical protein RchiOBHm_Chr6g0259601 [Rosa chinensis]
MGFRRCTADPSRRLVEERWRHRHRPRLASASLHGDGWALIWWLIWLRSLPGSEMAERLGALRWVPRVIEVFLVGWCWVHTNMLVKTFPRVWIWDPGDPLPDSVLCWIIPLSVLRLFSGGSSLPRFYKKSWHSHAVSITIACIGEQCSLCWVEFRFDWSADLLHARIANSDCWVYNFQGHDNGSVVGNYLEDDEDLPSEFASFSRKVSKQSFIVQEQPVDVVHLLVCSILALAPRRFLSLYAPHWDALLSDFNR